MEVCLCFNSRSLLNHKMLNYASETMNQFLEVMISIFLYTF